MRVVLLFALGPEFYCVDASQVLEVVPHFPLRALPLAPPFVAGLLQAPESLIPVIDLCQLCLHRPVRPLMSSRIILYRYRRGTLGLLAERVTTTAQLSPQDFAPVEILLPEAPFLGPVARHGDTLVQKVDIDQVLGAEVESLLFPDRAETAR